MQKDEGLNLRELLSKMSSQESLSIDFLNKIAKDSEPVILNTGDTLIKQGEKGKFIYLVLEGRFFATHNREGGVSKKLGEIGKGEMIGEMAMVTGEPHSATVIAIRRSTVFPLNTKQFASILHDHPLETLNLLQNVLTRSRKMYQRDNSIRSIALIAHSADVNLDDFVKKIAKALKKYSRMLLITYNKVEGMDKSKLLDWVSAQKSKYDLLVFQATSEHPEWREQCLNQADRILIIADAETPVDPGEVAALIGSNGNELAHIQRELVLLHPHRESVPCNTLEWIETLKTDHHHHLRKQYLPDYERLARRITNKSIAMVFSGGGAKGYAQYGVVRAFMEAGIPIDIVGAASAGTYVAGTVALERSTQESMKIMEQFAIKGTLNDYTLPLLSLFSGKKGTDMAKKYCGNRKIEDLWLPFFSVSTSLKSGRTFVHTLGPLWEAIRASSSIPGILPPVISMKKDDIWVDGGVTNNAPVDVAYRFSPGKIILVNTTEEKKFEGFDSFPPAISGWSVFWNRINPFAKKRRFPNIVSLLFRSNEVTGNLLLKKTLEDFPPNLIISPPVQQYGMLDYKFCHSIEEKGYQYAMQHIEEWKAMLLSEDN